MELLSSSQERIGNGISVKKPISALSLLSLVLLLQSPTGVISFSRVTVRSVNTSSIAISSRRRKLFSSSTSTALNSSTSSTILSPPPFKNKVVDDVKEDPFGPPREINALPIVNGHQRNNDDNKTIRERLYFDPSFTDITKPQTRPYNIQRVAKSPNVFLLQNFLTPFECKAIQHEALNNYNEDTGGMTQAKSKDESTSESTRLNCKVAWMNDSRLGGILNLIGEEVSDTFITDEARQSSNSKRSDLQVLNYSENGRFVLHHDGNDRILTVIFYINGVGETWLPLVNVVNNNDEEEEEDDDDDDDDDLGNNLKDLDGAINHVLEQKMRPGSNGILVSGTVKDDTDRAVKESQNSNPNVVSVNPGDAVAFYSYRSDNENDKKDWRSIHAGLPVEYTGEDGKWIATYWFHAPSLVN